jgi:hypothetical protein
MSYLKFSSGFKKVAWEINQSAAKDFSRGASRGYGMQDFKAGIQNIKNQFGFGGAGPAGNNPAVKSNSHVQMAGGTVQRSERPGT